MQSREIARVVDTLVKNKFLPADQREPAIDAVFDEIYSPQTKAWEIWAKAFMGDTTGPTHLLDSPTQIKA